MQQDDSPKELNIRSKMPLHEKRGYYVYSANSQYCVKAGRGFVRYNDKTYEIDKYGNLLSFNNDVKLTDWVDNPNNIVYFNGKTDTWYDFIEYLVAHDNFIFACKSSEVDGPKKLMIQMRYENIYRDTVIFDIGNFSYTYIYEFGVDLMREYYKIYVNGFNIFRRDEIKIQRIKNGWVCGYINRFIYQPKIFLQSGAKRKRNVTAALIKTLLMEPKKINASATQGLEDIYLTTTTESLDDTHFL